MDLRVLKDRSLAIGTLFTFILGFGLYSSVFIFPVFAQNLLGFTAMQTGLDPAAGRDRDRDHDADHREASAARGSAAADERPRLRLVLPLHAACSAQSTLASDRADFFWPLIFRGIGLGLLFVPLTTLALSNLRGPNIAQGTGLTNMMRQLGGSFGVALIATYVEKRTWAYRTRLLEHVSIYDFAVRERLQAITRGLQAKGSPPLEAQRQAYGALEGIVEKQTFLLTYMDAFRIVGIFFLLCIPLLLLFKRRKGAAPLPVGVH